MDTSKLATQKELKSVKAELKADIKDLKSETKSIRGEILRVEEKVENIQDEIKELKIDSQVRFDRLQNTLDSFVGGVDDLRIENTVGTHQTRELHLKVVSLEKRVKQLESSKQAS